MPSDALTIPADLVKEILDYHGPCDHIDHHGYCQSHGLQPVEECFVGRLAALASSPPQPVSGDVVAAAKDGFDTSSIVKRGTSVESKHFIAWSVGGRERRRYEIRSKRTNHVVAEHGIFRDRGESLVKALAAHFIALGVQQGVEAERARMIDELENAATDCDGHTPYSILMALAEEARDLTTAERQNKS